MEENLIISKLQEYLVSIEQSDTTNIDLTIWNIKTFIEQDEFLQETYNGHITKYNQLRINPNFQNLCNSLLNQICVELNSINFSINIDNITPCLGHTNQLYAITNLYFYNLDFWIDAFLPENQKTLLKQHSEIPLFQRNMWAFKEIYESCANSSLNQEGYKRSNTSSILTELEVLLNPISYSYHIFNTEIENRQTSRIQLFEQVKFASINILDDLILQVKNKSFNNEKQILTPQKVVESTEQITKNDKQKLQKYKVHYYSDNNDQRISIGNEIINISRNSTICKLINDIIRGDRISKTNNLDSAISKFNNNKMGKIKFLRCRNNLYEINEDIIDFSHS